MPQNRPMPGEIYRHFKDKMYQIVAVATHSETREPYVVYQALYGDYMTYIRPYDMFISEVDHVKYPQVKQTYRFAYVGSAAITEAQQQKEETLQPTSAVDSTKTQAKVTAPVIEDEYAGVDPRFLAFLDADTYEQKMEILIDMEDDLDDHLINQMAASIDEIVEDGKLWMRIDQLKRCIRTKARFELNR